MKLARLRVVQSSGFYNQVSLRGPKGKGHDDPPQRHLTAAGFVDGESVVVITEKDFESMKTVWDDYAGEFGVGVPHV